MTLSLSDPLVVLDNDTDSHYHIAKVVDVNENTTHLHYYATKSKRLRGAKWEPLYTLPNSNRVVTVQPDTIDRDCRQYMGVIDTRPIDDNLIILANVGMTDTNCVNARSRGILHKMIE